MASGLLSTRFSLSPPQTLLFELLIGSAVIGFTPPDSLARPISVPFVWACVHHMATHGLEHLRPRWASLFGGTGALVFFQFLDLAVIRRWNYKDQGPAVGRSKPQQGKSSITAPGETASTTATVSDADDAATASGFWERLKFGWNQMWALRHINSPYEVRNVPPFSSRDPAYVPSKAKFVLRESAIAVFCYLVMDLMGQRSPPSPEVQARIFNRALIPFFRRLGEVTWPQLKLRALSIVGFAVTFLCIVRGMSAAVGALAVGLGLSEPKNWRPQFGSVFDAYSIGNLWGKVWHQNLRSIVINPAKKITNDYLQLPRTGLAGRASTLFLSFFISGCVHKCAGVASGMDKWETGVVHFFLTQAFGIVVEESVQAGYRKLTGKKSTDPPSLFERCIGIVWVLAFMTWSGPVWLYPQASVPPNPNVQQGFLPLSIIKMWKARSSI